MLVPNNWIFENVTDKNANPHGTCYRLDSEDKYKFCARVTGHQDFDF